MPRPRICNARDRLIKCPECGLVGVVDEDQWHGRVSIDCPTEGCSYHETHDLSEED